MSRRVIAGMMAGALCAAGVVVAPAIGATAKPVARLAASRAVALRPPIGSFTPAAADPRLAAVFARGGLGASDFHFTPAETQRGQRAVTVAVRMRSNRGADQQLAGTPTNVGVAPIAYNLGVAVGWKRFAVAGDLAHVDLGLQPGSRDAADVSLSYRASRRLTGRIKAATDRPIGEVAALVDQPQSYSVDVGGSYSLTRRLDVTAGVRYRSDRERMAQQLTDDRRDSQAAYVGTVFRF